MYETWSKSGFKNVKEVSLAVVVTPALGMNPHSCFGEKQ